jgi:hypothetical protein
MAYVRAKRTRRGTAKYYLCEAVREGKRVRQRVLAYLGPFPTPADALAELPYRIAAREDAYRRQVEAFGEPVEPDPRALERLDRAQRRLRREQALRERLGELRRAGVIVVSEADLVAADRRLRQRAVESEQKQADERQLFAETRAFFEQRKAELGL